MFDSSSHYGPVTPRRVRAPGLQAGGLAGDVGRVPSPGVPFSSIMRIAVSARAALDEVKENQKFWYGDFYPLTQCTLGPAALIAWQLHRSDLNAGMVLAFRHKECPYPVLQAALNRLDPQTNYRVDLLEEGMPIQQQTLTGRQLMANFEFRMTRRGTSLLVRYKPQP